MKLFESFIKFVVIVGVFLIIVTLMTACSTVGKVAGLAGGLNDEALASSEFAICKGASVGSVLRRYNTPEKADAWVALCREDNAASVIIR